MEKAISPSPTKFLSEVSFVTHVQMCINDIVDINDAYVCSLELSRRVDIDSMQRLLAQKEKLSSEQLCNGLESEFAKILEYSRSLSSTQKPDYRFIHKLLDDIIERK
ncbi:uncharacterized protein EV154DRAFT_488877 [Mucor mucedo]|uniref:uncharacterized protein n=1 Tax=Mucor mucedo TaxID=29922 RepID=UPI00222103A5|nr:uncharacterized protein EV154DRAFT_488877 [Mucor mucedo]KAI7864543.1 hypothetical protein EV154DRAFT_488877 [Mucor mucedo]